MMKKNRMILFVVVLPLIISVAIGLANSRNQETVSVPEQTTKEQNVKLSSASLEISPLSSGIGTGPWSDVGAGPLTYKPSYGRYEFDLRPGDIIHEEKSFPLLGGTVASGHSVMVEGRFLDPTYGYYWRVIESGPAREGLPKVVRSVLDDERFYNQKGHVLHLRAGNYVSDEQRQGAVNFAISQLGKPWIVHYDTIPMYSDAWMCSTLVWASWMHQGVNLVPMASRVLPNDIYNSLSDFKTLSWTSRDQFTFNTTNLANDNIQIDSFKTTYQNYFFQPPLYIGNRIVTQIGSAAFKDNNVITELFIPQAIVYIGSFAFANMSNLYQAYFDTSGPLSAINDSTFANCTTLTSITIPFSVASIGVSAFSNCTRLKSITIPASVISISSTAFSGCSTLATIAAEANNLYFASQNGILYNKTKTQLIHIPQALAGAISIPKGITSIAASTFANRINLTSVSFENLSQIHTISSSAFYNCANLSAVTIPASVTSVGENAFLGTKVNLITLDKQGGSGGHSFIAVSAGSIMPSIIVPSKERSLFGGYFTEPNGGGTQYYDSNGIGTRPYDISHGSKLYAKWTSIEVSGDQEIASGIIGSSSTGGVEWKLYGNGTASVEGYICVNGTWGITIEFPFNFTSYVLISSSESVEIIYIGPNSLFFYSYDYIWVELSIKLIGCV